MRGLQSRSIFVDSTCFPLKTNVDFQNTSLLNRLSHMYELYLILDSKSLPRVFEKKISLSKVIIDKLFSKSPGIDNFLRVNCLRYRNSAYSINYVLFFSET